MDSSLINQMPLMWSLLLAKFEAFTMFRKWRISSILLWKPIFESSNCGGFLSKRQVYNVPLLFFVRWRC